MARFFVLMLSMFFLVACGLSPNLPEGTASQEAAQNPGVTKSEPFQPPVRQDQEREKEEVLAAAKAYMERQGLKVGNGPGEIVLSLENLWNGRAVVLYGFAASEFFAELGLRRGTDGWRVTHDQARYFAYEDVEEPAAALAQAEGYVFAEEPGKYLLGVKDLAPRRAVLLVAPYGEPWAWEYILEKEQDSWVIRSKNKAKEHWEPAR